MKRVLLTGGGTFGSVTTLLATVPFLRKKGTEISWLGTGNGPERSLIEQQGIAFTGVVSAKFRRYVTWRHLCVPFELAIGCVQSFFALRRIQPDIVVSAGGFVSVPVALVGRLLGIPLLVHQQDVRVGLANWLMIPYAEVVTVAFEKTQETLSRQTEWIGNPVRDLSVTTKAMTTDAHYPTVLVFGGGTGAQTLNALVSSDLCEVATVIHVTGKGKKTAGFTHKRYQAYEFLQEEMSEALSKADVVVCRAGLGTITELAALKKAAIVIPLPGTHQEDNAELLASADAAVVLHQTGMTSERLTQEIQALLKDDNKRHLFSERMSQFHRPEATRQLADRILSVSSIDR